MGEYLDKRCRCQKFEIIGVCGRDKKHAYWGYDRLEGIEPATFQTAGWLFMKDKNGVYYEGELIKSADPHTFVALGTVPYGKDRKYIYRGLLKIRKADPNTFVVIN